MMNKKKAEIANTWTHVVSLGLFCLMDIALFAKAWPHHSPLLIFSLILFSIAEVLMLGSSSLYHYAKNPDTKKKLRYFDHCAIYVSIAGSYSPILLYTIGGVLGWTCFIVIWTLVVAGIFYKIFALGKHPRLSLILYLLMGWMVVFIIKPVWNNFPVESLLSLLFEGIFFSTGTYFFWKDESHTYYHSIWHILIFLGCLSHCLVLWFLW